MQHVISAQSSLLWTGMKLAIEVSVTLLSQQVTAEIQVIVVLKEKECSQLCRTESSKAFLNTDYGS